MFIFLVQASRWRLQRPQTASVLPDASVFLGPVFCWSANEELGGSVSMETSSFGSRAAGARLDVPRE